MTTHEVAGRLKNLDQACEILIIGSGISGTLAATVLSRAGYDVGLVDRHAEYPRDFRAEHLDGSMIDVLARLGLLEGLTDGLYKGETVSLARFGRVIGTTPTLNYGLRYESLVKRARMALPPSVRVITGRVTKIDTSDSLQHVSLADNRTLTARLIILATGQGYGLCKQIGLRRRTLREAHSLTFGFDLEPVDTATFPHSFLVYQREQIHDRIDYLAAFTLGSRTRVNLFTYRDYREPWTKAFIADPDAGLRQVLPGLERVLGRYRTVGTVEARPVDLYVSEDYIRDGVVVVGDAFQASCPATGMGMFRLLVDIEQLTRVHVPRWLETPGTGSAKIAEFYRDPVKLACDAKALHDSEYRRGVSTEIGMRWNIHRARVHAMERITAWRHRLPAAQHPRIAEQHGAASLAAG